MILHKKIYSHTSTFLRRADKGWFPNSKKKACRPQKGLIRWTGQAMLSGKGNEACKCAWPYDPSNGVRNRPYNLSVALDNPYLFLSVNCFSTTGSGKDAIDRRIIPAEYMRILSQKKVFRTEFKDYFWLRTQKISWLATKIWKIALIVRYFAALNRQMTVGTVTEESKKTDRYGG